MYPNEPKRSLEFGAVLICAASAAFAGCLLVVTGVGVDFLSSKEPLLILGCLGGAYIVYRWWRPEPIISDICGGLAVLLFAGVTAGIISLAGVRLGAPLIDGKLAAFDSAFLLDTRSIVTAVANRPILARFLGFAYYSSFPIIVVSVAFLGWARRVKSLWQLAFVFAFTLIGCATISVFFPAIGAFSHFAYPAEVLKGLPSGAGIYHLPTFEYYRDAVAPVISLATSDGVVTFPSFHCCLALMTTFAYVKQRWLFRILLLWNALVIVSTIPIGGHYIVDLLVGASLWALAYALATALWREAGETRVGFQPPETASGRVLAVADSSGK
jgi:membrane-associated phospholipid phosphatase